MKRTEISTFLLFIISVVIMAIYIVVGILI